MKRVLALSAGLLLLNTAAHATVSVTQDNNASNPSLFNNNDLNDGGPFFDIEYDGFTNVFTASATGLAAGSHTLKLAIADTGDSAWDSAVFIQAGTLSTSRPRSRCPARSPCSWGRSPAWASPTAASPNNRGPRL